MADVVAPPLPPVAAALRRELEFVKSLLKSGRSVDEMVAAANAASRVASRAADEAKKALYKWGTELTIRGLPTGAEWDWRGLKRWLQSRGVGQRAIKDVDKDPELSVGVVRFINGAECGMAADMLATCDPPLRDGSKLTLEAGTAAEYKDKGPRPKRQREGEDAEAPVAKAARAAPDVCAAVCPWHQVPYSKQLTDKHDRIILALAGITQEVDRVTAGPTKPEWVRAARARGDVSTGTGWGSGGGASGGGGGGYGRGGGRGGRGGRGGGGGRGHNADDGGATAEAAAAAAPTVCCPLLGILRSPLLERYRNKSEFTAGLDENEKPNVGFLRGAFQDGITCVGSPEPTRHTSLAAVKLAAAATAYIRDVSKFAVYDKRRQEGYWRLVLVREGSRKSFLPVPVAASDDAAAAASPPTSLDNPTFASLDPYSYLVTFGSAAAEAGQEAVDGVTAPPVLAGTPVAQVSEAEPVQPPPDEVLVMLQVNPTYTTAMAEPAAEARELRAMTAALRAAAAAAGMPLSTVRVQLHSGVSNAAPYDAPIREVPAAPPAGEAGGEAEAVTTAVAASSGSGFIHDSLCELRFRISATAFFQVNSPATCVLYKVVGDWAAAQPRTLLLDICCGTGTIGLTMASKVAKVVGVDNVVSAVEDARMNAELNGITNAEFVAGKAEDALPGILDSHATSDAYDDVVAVCDPPRAGLHKSVLRALLGCEKIRRLVFVSCNPDNLVQNVALLCSPPDNRVSSGLGGYHRGGRGRPSAASAVNMGGSFTPFRPVKAVALDLFPHTSHVEAVMVLER